MASKSSSKHDQNKKHYTGKNLEEKVYLYAHEKLFNWIVANVKTIGIIVGVVALIVIIGISWRAYQKGVTEKALTLEGKAFKLHQKIQTELASKNQETASETPSDAQNPYQEVIVLYQEIIDQYSGTPSAGRAQYLLGSIAYQRGNYDEAKMLFSAYLKAYAQGTLAVQAEESIGYIFEQQKDFQQALNTFKRLETRVSDTRKPAILLAIARNYEALGQTEQAITTYQSVVDSNTSFSLKNTAKERLDILQTAQRQPQIVAPAATQEPAVAPSEQPASEASPVSQPEPQAQETQPATSNQSVSEEPSAESQQPEEQSAETTATPAEPQAQKTPSEEPPVETTATPVESQAQETPSAEKTTP
ncbi:TPR repeat protein [Candidatus Vecturithrix granuli]|uniref:TPR repeat protein n=1 Tax=Vecturithrix granuli TaxID=1499967 RepID=A0A0S6W5B6_VECG1|nr:TPR repeat protein [Candidatus Vecturithrix granuli]